MTKTAKNKKNILALAILALLALGVAGYIKFSQPTYAPSSTADTKIHAGPKTDTAPTPQGAAQNNPSHPATSTLPKPIGPNNNVSSVSLSGATGMESVCRSVAGASCYIQASKDGRIINVSESKTIGGDSLSDGVILNWDAKQLSVGKWSIQAIASKDGQKSTSDPQILEVKS